MGYWKHQTVRWTVILAWGLQLACGHSPAQPSPTSGVTVYQHPNFDGQFYMFMGDFHNFDDLRGPCGTVG